jgi:hypothetical protein
MDFTGLDLSVPSTWTNEIPCLYGAYRWLNGTPMHYFNTNISVRDLHLNARLMSQIEGVEKWGFEALFQRSISWDRVDEIVERYLKNPSRFKFFPPVTLALLPVSEGRMHSDYATQKIETRVEDQFLIWSMPGIEIRFFTQGKDKPRDAGQIAMIRWDTSKLTAVAIDGQHRVAALKKFRDSAHPDAANSDVPATFLFFDPKLPKEKHLLNLVREIFVDVNHNARTVDESRIILLDDRDFIRRAARSSLIQAFNEVAEPQPLEWKGLETGLETEILNGIPQELIDLSLGRQGADVSKLRPWQYISVFNVYRILKFFVFENKWETFEKAMGLTSLGAGDGALGAAVAAKRPDPEDDEGGSQEEDSFVFSPAIGDELLSQYFDENVRPLIMGVLTGIRPYKDFISNAMAKFNSPQGTEFREFLIAESSVDRGSRSILSENFENHKPDVFATVVAMQEELRRPDGWENDLIWYSVTQRALFGEIPMIRRALEYFCDPEEPKTQVHFIDRYVRALSALWVGGVFKRDFKPVGTMPLWFGSPLELKNGEFSIRPSDAAARKMAKLIRILVAAVVAKEYGWSAKEFFEHGFGGNNAGLKAAFTNLRTNYVKYLKSDDWARRGKLRKEAWYAESAERRLKNLVKRVVYDLEADPELDPEEAGESDEPAIDNTFPEL